VTSRIPTVSAVCRMVLSCLLAWAVLAAPAHAAAQTDGSTFKEPFELTVTNPCNGEVIVFSGTALVRWNLVQGGPAGALHYRETQGVIAQGTGSLGNSYIYKLQEESGFTHYTDTDTRRLFTEVTSARIVGVGTAPDFAVRTLGHANADEDGNVTNSFFRRDTTECLA
jgi:hypothetical protein